MSRHGRRGRNRRRRPTVGELIPVRGWNRPLIELEPETPRAALELPAADMLTALGIEGDQETPTRLVKALHEMTEGRLTDPCRHLEV